MASLGPTHGKETTANKGAFSPANVRDEHQLDFEITFFTDILDRHPNHVDALRALANNLTLKGRIRDGLEMDKRLVRLRPKDALAHYNLACSYALLRNVDAALTTLRRAIELGYRDFHYLRQDKDLDSIRQDPRYRQLLREFEGKLGHSRLVSPPKAS
jgi:tetratricopeptide (TPR) repeat protein